MGRPQETIDPSGSRRAARVEAGVVVGFWAAIAWPFLIPGRYVTGFDTLAYAGPNLAFTFERWRAGELATWNDRIFGGVAHLANPQAGALYLPKLPFAWVETHRALGLLTALHLLWLGLGVLWLVRRLGLRPPAGAVASAVVLGSGMAMTKSLQFEQVLVVSWAPWLLVSTDGVLRSERMMRTWFPALCVTVAAVLTAGHPQLVYILIPLVGVWVVVRCADAAAWRRLPVVAGAAVLGVVLALPQLLPTIGLLAQATTSGGRPLAASATAGYSVYPTLAAQTVLGDPFAANPAFTVNGFEAVSFIGSVAAALALVGLLGAVALRSATFTAIGLAAAMAGAALLALGPRTVAYRAAFELVPGFDQARVPARWMVVFDLCAALLAAFGIDALRHLPWGKVWRAGAAVGLVAMALVAWWLPRPSSPAPLLWVAGLGLVVLALAVPHSRAQGRVQAALVVLLVAELAALNLQGFARKSLTDEPFDRLGGPITRALSDRPERVISLAYDRFDQPAYLVSSLRPNANVVFGIRSLDGYDGGIQVTRRWVRLVSALARPPVNPELTLRSQIAVPLDPATYARLGVRWAVIETEALPADQLVPGWRGPVLSEGSVELWENPAFESPAMYHAATTRGPPDFRSGPISVRSGRQLRCAAPCPPQPVRVVQRDASRIVLAPVVDGPGVIVVSEQFDPGWRATVDGRRVPTVEVDGFLVGVAVGPGSHRVVLAHEPPGLRAGLVLSALAAACILLLALVAQRMPWAVGRRRTRSASAE